ncbi:MAG: hypothetical protein PHX21_12890 [bacterium]|nr:hypothetical protein [bacterium]
MKKLFSFLLPIAGVLAAGFGLIYLKRKQLLSSGAAYGAVPTTTPTTVPTTTPTTGTSGKPAYALPGTAQRNMTPSPKALKLFGAQSQWKTDTIYLDSGLGGWFVYDKNLNIWIFFFGAGVPDSFYVGKNGIKGSRTVKR